MAELIIGLLLAYGLGMSFWCWRLKVRVYKLIGHIAQLVSENRELKPVRDNHGRFVKH